MLRNLSLFLWFGDSEKDFDKSNFLFLLSKFEPCRLKKMNFWLVGNCFFFVVIPYGKYVSGSERYVCLL